MNAADPAPARSLDGAQLRCLLRCYYRLSCRGKLAQTMGGTRSGKPRGLVVAAVMYAFVGLMVGLVAFSGVDVFTYAVIVHCMTFFVVGMAVTSESGDVLFNASETDVLMHRPIHPRTLLLAKSLHLIGFTLVLAGALNLFPVFFGLAAREARAWFPLAHAFSTLWLSVFCAAAVVCAYGLIVRLFDREKFDNFAAWSQVGMSILFIAGSQLMPRGMDHMDRISFSASASWLLPMPPAWFAALDALCGGRQGSPALWLLAAIGLVATVLLCFAAIGRLAPGYGEALARLGESRSRAAQSGRAQWRTSRRWNPVLGWWLRDPVERATFRLAAVYMRRDREIKLRLYPSLSMFIVFPVMGLLSRKGGPAAMFPLMMIWMAAMMPMTALEALRSSSQHAAAEVFGIAPLAGAAPVFHGVRKAALYYLVLPVLCFTGIVVAWFLPQERHLLWLGLPGLIALPTLSLAPGLFSSYLPLSRPPMRGEQSTRNMALIFGAMLANGALLGVGYLAWKLGWFGLLVAGEIVLVAVVHRILIRHIGNRPMPRDPG